MSVRLRRCRYDRIRVPASTNLSILAQASDTSVQYMRYLNPHLRSNMTPPEPYIINVPAGKANEVVAVFKRIPASKVNNTNLATSVQRRNLADDLEPHRRHRR